MPTPGPAPSPAAARIASAILWAAFALPTAAHAASPAPDKVTLRESSIVWHTVKFRTDADDGFIGGSLDTKTIVARSFRTYVLENRYLRVTLLPEFGGRILSILDKPTGHEELYRTEVGVPYGMGAGNFYYDWLMVYGGIFPTFPDPEHGKSWLKPWAFRVVTSSDDEVTVSMSFKDDFAYAAAPARFRRAPTGIEATYEVTLKAGRAALDTQIVLKNPQPQTVPYEYWTCTTLAPGSDPDRPAATAGAEIVAPIRTYTTPRWSANLAAGDQSAGGGDSLFEKLRAFRNWPTMGIAYAAPDMQGGNFWGVINHDNDEGIIRVADNNITRGLKMWTWGFPSRANAATARTDPKEQQPYVELWAGVSDQFFHSAIFPALGTVSIAESYSPTVGMRNVTQANPNILINLAADSARATLELVSLEPEAPLHVALKRGETVVFDGSVAPDPQHGNRISAPLPAGSHGDRIMLSITAADGRELISAETPIK